MSFGDRVHRNSCWRWPLTRVAGDDRDGGQKGQFNPSPSSSSSTSSFLTSHDGSASPWSGGGGLTGEQMRMDDASSSYPAVSNRMMDANTNAHLGPIWSASPLSLSSPAAQPASYIAPPPDHKDDDVYDCLDFCIPELASMNTCIDPLWASAHGKLKPSASSPPAFLHPVFNRLDRSHQNEAQSAYPRSIPILLATGFTLSQCQDEHCPDLLSFLAGHDFGLNLRILSVTDVTPRTFNKILRVFYDGGQNATDTAHSLLNGRRYKGTSIRTSISVIVHDEEKVHIRAQEPSPCPSTRILQPTPQYASTCAAAKVKFSDLFQPSGRRETFASPVGVMNSRQHSTARQRVEDRSWGPLSFEKGIHSLQREKFIMEAGIPSPTLTPMNDDEIGGHTLLRLGSAQRDYSHKALTMTPPSSCLRFKNNTYNDRCDGETSKMMRTASSLSTASASSSLAGKPTLGSRIGRPSATFPQECEINLASLMDETERRTTFMIRNIPNKYTQKDMLDFLNAMYPRCFDFLYLRMDFVNKCNVGYCFVNFTERAAVFGFLRDVVGRHWPMFKSDKRAALCFATIQGRDALIAKFRNSCVMNEPPEYRPMLFYTNGPKRGDPEPFPVPGVPS